MSEGLRIFLNSLGLTVVASGLSFSAAWYWFSRNAAVKAAEAIATEHAKTLARITELETKLALVNQAVIPISTAFQAILIKELTHYHTPEMDALLVKLGPPSVITIAEQQRLEVLLVARTTDMGPEISGSERDAAAILPAVIRRAQAEADVLISDAFRRIRLATVAAVVSVNAAP